MSFIASELNSDIYYLYMFCLTMLITDLISDSIYYKKQEDYRTCTVDELCARLIFVL